MIKTEKICCYCGKKHTRESKWCSSYCCNNARYELKTSPICLNCKLPSKKGSNFCSSICYRKYNYKPITLEIECKFCKKIFISNRLTSFCSVKCRNKFNYWNKINNNICSCGKKLTTKTICDDCCEKKKKYKQKEQRPLEQQILNSAKARAKKYNLPINITINDIIVPEFCPVLGIKLKRGVGKSQPNSPSLDRIIPELGYVKGNIMIISHKANTMKSNSTPEEIKLLLEYMTKYYKT